MENTTLYLELSNDHHHKFYEITLFPASCVVIATYGRIGYQGYKKLYHFPTPEEAQQFYTRQMQKKLKKGYEPAVKGERPPRPAFIHPGQLRIFFSI